MATNGEIQESNNNFYLTLNRENDIDIKKLFSEDGIEILDFIEGLNLINVRASPEYIQKMVETTDIGVIDKSLIEKIEPLILQKIKSESTEQEVKVSVLVDINPYNKEIIMELRKMERIEIMKEYPFVSAVHVLIPMNKLLQLASISTVNRISDSKGQIFPLGGA